VTAQLELHRRGKVGRADLALAVEDALDVRQLMRRAIKVDTG